jgi:aminoglycoside phosphotransferase (APT) family kinase protein
MALKNELDKSAARTALEKWMATKLPSNAGLRIDGLDIPQASGLSALTVLFSASWFEQGRARTEHMVARSVPKSGGVFETADLGREFNLFRTLKQTGAIPIPSPLFLETEDDSILGAPFMVMSRVDGRVARDDPPYTVQGWVMDLAPVDRAKLVDNALASLAALHALNCNELGLAWLGDNDMGNPSIGVKLKGWRRYFDWASNGEPNPLIELAFEKLKSNAPQAESETVISWGDARLGNMIVADDLSVAAVIDWEMAGLGCREIDLAWWLYTRRFHTEAIGTPLPEGFPSEEEVLLRYAQLSGYTPKNIDYYVLFAGLRLSIAFVRLANMMIAHGLLPQGAPMATNNPCLTLLASCLGVEPPKGESQYFVGNR